MSASDSNTANPYQPPTVNAPDRRLPFDTEFLISETCVLCDGDVHLPQVCIKSGSTTDLVKRSGRLKWYPVWVGLLLAIVGLASLSVLEMGFQTFRALSQGAGVDLQTGIFLAFWGVSVTAVFLVRYWCRRTVAATWYLQRRYVDRYKKVWQVVGICSVLLMTGAYFVAGSLVDWAFILLVIFLVLPISSSPPTPGLQGTHEELNVVMGLSPEFLKQVQSIIDQHNQASKTNSM